MNYNGGVTELSMNNVMVILCDDNNQVFDVSRSVRKILGLSKNRQREIEE